MGRGALPLSRCDRDVVRGYLKSGADDHGGRDIEGHLLRAAPRVFIELRPAVRLCVWDKKT